MQRTFCEKMFVGCKDMQCCYLHSMEEAAALSGNGIAEAIKGVWFTRPEGSLKTLTNSWKMCQRFLDQEDKRLREIEQAQDYSQQLQQKLRVEQLREQFLEYFSKDQLPMRDSLSKPFIVSFADDSDDEENEEDVSALRQPITVRLSEEMAADDVWLDQQYQLAQHIRNETKKEFHLLQWSARLYTYHQQWNGEQDMEIGYD